MEVDSLYSTLPTVSGTGETVKLENTIKTKFKTLEISENTSEADNINMIICNKNLLNIEDSTHTNSRISTDEDTITLTSTSTTDANAHLYLAYPVKLKADTTYAYSINVLSGTVTNDTSGSALWFRFYDADSNVMSYNLRINCTSEGIEETYTYITFTPNEDIEIYEVVAYLRGGNIYDNCTVTLQLEVAEEATDYIKHEEQIYDIDTTADISTQLENATSYADTTNIFSTDELSPIFTVEAYANTSTLISNLQSAVSSLTATEEE